MASFYSFFALRGMPDGNGRRRWLSLASSFAMNMSLPTPGETIRAKRGRT
jgi:hypothetical protein